MIQHKTIKNLKHIKTTKSKTPTKQNRKKPIHIAKRNETQHNQTDNAHNTK